VSEASTQIQKIVDAYNYVYRIVANFSKPKSKTRNHTHMPQSS